MPLLDCLNLERSENILVAGAGGGFDVYAGIPLYLELQERGKNIILANYSFTRLEETNSKSLAPYCREINAHDTLSPTGYFPERALVRWLQSKKCTTPLFAFEPTGVQNLRRAYEAIVDKYNIDTIILVDGGTDSLMHGDEEHIGTPVEDSTSVMAVQQLKVPQKYLSGIGFGIDEISHSLFLDNLAALGLGYLGLSELNGTYAQKFIDAVNFANREMPGNESIICNSIASALEGNFGEYHRTARTHRSKLSITPLMKVYWHCELEAVARRIAYGEQILNTHTHEEVAQEIKKYRLGLLEWRTPSLRIW